MEAFKEPQVQLAACFEKKCHTLTAGKCSQHLWLLPVLLSMGVLNMEMHACQFAS